MPAPESHAPPPRAVVVLSGPAPPPEEALAACEGAFVVAADGGGNHLAAWGRVPDVLVGDMDSIRPEVLAEFEARGVRVLRHPLRKDHADGALALEEALASGAREVVLLAATGGRLDLTLATFHLARRAAARGVRARAVSDEGRFWTVTPALPLALDIAAGSTVSVIPLTDVAEGVDLVGFEYPLRGARMESGDPYGVSNVALAGGQRVACASGILAVIEPRGA